MQLALVYTRALVGIRAPLVTVETHISNGLPRFAIVGLPETAVKESKERVRSALLNSGFDFPCRRITVNLAPADLPKEGSRFDLAIALGILVASRQLPHAALAEYEFSGELALSGELRPIPGALPLALATQTSARALILPQENANQISWVTGLRCFAAPSLLAVCAHLTGTARLPLTTPMTTTAPLSTDEPDLQDLHGQLAARRALEIAASGGHSLLLVGPPGTGKTLLANRLPSILPKMTEEETIANAIICSIANHHINTLPIQRRPFRAPHHTSSSVTLLGGGNPPRPGEISLAHQGVLFLDELPEFKRSVLESLREPLESGKITLARPGRQLELPAQFQLIAAMNPCPCGYLHDTVQACRCTLAQIQRYQARLSGPLLDRIDLRVQVARCPQAFTLDPGRLNNETSAEVRTRVSAAQQKQLARAGQLNAKLPAPLLTNYCILDTASQHLLAAASEKFNLSLRGYQRILRVARTIADLADSPQISKTHLAEALSYRCLKESAFNY